MSVAVLFYPLNYVVSLKERNARPKMTTTQDTTRFFCLTIAISWLLQLPLILKYFGLNVPGFLISLVYLSVAGPAVAAFFLTYRQSGIGGIRDLLRRLFDWRQRWQWYLFALIVVIAVRLLALGMLQLGPYEKPAAHFLPRQEVLVIFLVWMLLVPLEEFGWRGLALPQLLTRRSALSAAMIVGFWWGLWHLPILVVQAQKLPGGSLTAGFPLFMFSVLLTSVVMTWLFLRTSGSLLIATVFHAASNTANQMIIVSESANLSHAVVALLLALLLTTVLVVWERERFFNKR